MAVTRLPLGIERWKELIGWHWIRLLNETAELFADRTFQRTIIACFFCSVGKCRMKIEANDSGEIDRFRGNCASLLLHISLFIRRVRLLLVSSIGHLGRHLLITKFALRARSRYTSVRTPIKSRSFALFRDYFNTFVGELSVILTPVTCQRYNWTSRRRKFTFIETS